MDDFEKPPSKQDPLEDVLVAEALEALEEGIVANWWQWRYEFDAISGQASSSGESAPREPGTAAPSRIFGRAGSAFSRAKLSGGQPAAAAEFIVAGVISGSDHGGRVWDAMKIFQQQTYASKCIVLLDDGDVARLADQGGKSIRVIRVPDRSDSRASRRILSQIPAGMICFLEPGVSLEATYLEKAVLRLAGQPEAAWVTAAARLPESDRKAMSWHAARPLCPVMRRSSLLAAGGALPPPAAQDQTGFWRALHDAGLRGSAVNEPLLLPADASALQPLDGWTHSDLPMRPGAEVQEVLKPIAWNKIPSARRPVVFMVPWLTTGGADRLALMLMRDLRERGHALVVFAYRDSPENLHDTTAEYMEITPYVYNLPRLLNPLDWPVLVYKVLSRLNAPTIVILSSTWAYRHLPRIRSMNTRAKVVELQLNHTAHIADHLLARPWIDTTLCAHSRLRDFFREHLHDRGDLRILNVGIDLPVRRATSEIPEEIAGLPRPLLAWYGRMADEKRPEWFVELARELGDRAGFVMLGGGEKLEEARRRTEGLDNVRILGYVPDPLSILQECDLFLAPSAVEGISITLMEALALGVPVVATDVGGTSEAVVEGVNGFLFHIDDYSGWRDEVKRLVEDPGALEALKSRARAAPFPDRFTVDKMCERFAAIVEEPAPEPPETASEWRITRKRTEDWISPAGPAVPPDG